MKRTVLFKIGVLIFIFCTFLINSEDSSAVGHSLHFGETISIKSEYGFEYVTMNEVNSKKKVKIKVEITNVFVYDQDGNVINDTINVCYDNESRDKIWYVKTGETLTFVDYADEYDNSFDLETDSANKFSLDVKITKVSDAELTINCHKAITMKDTDLKKVRPKVYYGDEDVSEFADFKVKSSKKYLVNIDTSYSDVEDYFYLSGNYESGKCKITVTAKYKGQTCSDSFILTVKSTLRKNLYVIGELYSYNTRSNVFTMLLTNRSKKQITIYSKGAVALDDDYVSFDRNVKLSKNKSKIVIKPGEGEKIHWKVIGSTTWYKVGDFEIHFKCQYKGKASWLCVQGDSVYIWRQKKWKEMS